MKPSEAVTEYARKFLTAGEENPGHSVCSPLGAWLLSSLVVGGEEGVLAREIFETPNALVSNALALWVDTNQLTPTFTEWYATLSENLEFGDIPTQEEADEWAAENTKGMIKEFPTTIAPDLSIVFANALATKFAWVEKFNIVSSSELGGVFAGRTERALSSAYVAGHQAFLLDTRLGRVGVHVGISDIPDSDSADDEVQVVSVIADPKRSAQEVQLLAVDIAEALFSEEAMARHGFSRVRVWDLADDDLAGGFWDVEEGTAYLTGYPVGGRASSHAAYIPSWKIQSDINLLSPVRPGIRETLETLGGMLRESGPASVKQSAYAAFTRYGFEAAAVTAVAMFGSNFVARTQYPNRALSVRFGHPYAVVAVSSSLGAWNSVPLFHAWVTETQEAD